jgi:hypothetical protein
MKKLSISVLSALLLLATFPSVGYAGTNPVETSTQTAEVDLLTNRLYVIHAIDKTELSKPEKKALLSEVKTIQSRLKTMENGGVYISVGAIIIILLLVIILF